MLFYVVLVDGRFYAVSSTYDGARIYAQEMEELGRQVELIDSEEFRRREKIKKTLDKSEGRCYNSSIERR